MTTPQSQNQFEPDDDVTIDGIDLLGELSPPTDSPGVREDVANGADIADGADDTIDGAELLATIERPARWRPPPVDRNVPPAANTAARTLNLTVVAVVFALFLVGSLFV